MTKKRTTKKYVPVAYILICFFVVSGEVPESSPFLSGPPPNRKRRARTQFDYYAVQRLETVFRLNQYPDIVMRESLADDIGVSEARVQVCVIIMIIDYRLG